MKSSHLFKAIAAAALLAGCASVPAPTEQLATSQAAVRAAEEVGAGNAPKAALHLKLARDQVAEAQRQIEDDDNQRARMLLMRAEADAELALALARETSIQSDAQEAIDKVRTMQRQIGGSSDTPSQTQ